ncbi:MAG: metallophosphoesterase [Bacteroidales bacterium]|nr:metallophosphoesterase [Bacteroidales bacterium]
MLTAPANGYRMYICTDIHTDEYPHRFEAFVRSMRSDGQAVGGLLLGDIANRKGSLGIAAAVADTTAATGNGAPLMAIVGNHDLFFGQWDDFKRYFGSSTYCFTVSTPGFSDLYIMLDSGGGCHGRRQMDWLKTLLRRRGDYRHCVVCTHVNLFRTDLSQFVSGNLPLEETYQLMELLSENGVSLVLQGHDHHREDVVFGGVRYLTLDCLKDGTDNASYLVLEVGDRLLCDFKEQ